MYFLCVIIISRISSLIVSFLGFCEIVLNKLMSREMFVNLIKTSVLLQCKSQYNQQF